MTDNRAFEGARWQKMQSYATERSQQTEGGASLIINKEAEGVLALGTTSRHQVYASLARDEHESRWEPYVDAPKDEPARATFKLEPLNGEDDPDSVPKFQVRANT